MFRNRTQAGRSPADELLESFRNAFPDVISTSKPVRAPVHEPDVETIDTSKHTTPPSKENAKARFQCEICPKAYTRNANLVDHIESAHQSSPIRHACGQCETTFLRKSDRDRHVRLQHGQHRYVCGEHPSHNGRGCGKAFARLDAVNEHRHTFLCTSSRVNITSPQRTGGVGTAQKPKSRKRSARTTNEHQSDSTQSSVEPASLGSALFETAAAIASGDSASRSPIPPHLSGEKPSEELVLEIWHALQSPKVKTSIASTGKRSIGKLQEEQYSEEQPSTRPAKIARVASRSDSKVIQSVLQHKKPKTQNLDASAKQARIAELQGAFRTNYPEVSSSPKQVEEATGNLNLTSRPTLPLPHGFTQLPPQGYYTPTPSGTNTIYHVQPEKLQWPQTTQDQSPARTSTSTRIWPGMHQQAAAMHRATQVAQGNLSSLALRHDAAPAPQENTSIETSSLQHTQNPFKDYFSVGHRSFASNDRIDPSGAPAMEGLARLTQNEHKSSMPLMWDSLPLDWLSGPASPIRTAGMDMLDVLMSQSNDVQHLSSVSRTLPQPINPLASTHHGDLQKPRGLVKAADTVETHATTSTATEDDAQGAAMKRLLEAAELHRKTASSTPAQRDRSPFRKGSPYAPVQPIPVPKEPVVPVLQTTAAPRYSCCDLRELTIEQLQKHHDDKHRNRSDYQALMNAASWRRLAPPGSISPSDSNNDH